MSSQPFNSPRQALDWLKRRKRIESVEGMTIYKHERPMRLYMPDEMSDPEDRLDSQAEAMLMRYGRVFKKPKAARPYSGIFGGIYGIAVSQQPVNEMAATEWQDGSVIANHNIAYDSVPATALNPPVRVFAPPLHVLDDYVAVDMESHDALYQPTGGPDVAPPTPSAD